MELNKTDMRKIASWLVGGGLFVTALIAASPSGLLVNLKKVSPETLLVVMLLASSNILVVAFRFWRMLDHCGIFLRWRTVLRACLAGNLASVAFIPLLAQVAGRQSILSRHGLSAVTTASVSAYERILLAVISASAAIVATSFLIGLSAVGEFADQLALTQVTIVLLIAALIGYALGRTPAEAELVNILTRKKSVLALMETSIITVVGQGLMIVAFAAAFHWAAPELNWPQLIASGAVVSFAASIPLSVGGWGIREAASVFVLGALGVNAADAMAASVLVGACSTLAVLVTSPISMALKESHDDNTPKQSVEQMIRLDGAASWMLGMSVIALMFFQVHVPLGGTVLNVNLGDPFALLAFAAVALTLLQARRLPDWRLAGFNGWLVFFTIALIISCAVGIFRFGVTPWAVGNKLMGWLVLMGYLCTGYLLTTQHRSVLLRIAEIALTVIFAIVWFKIAIRLTPWLPDLAQREAPNFEGFSGNRNAFAFQLCAVLALTLGYLRPFLRLYRARLPALTAMMIGIATLLLGLVLSGSRTGMIVTAVLLLLSLIFQRGSRSFLAASIALALTFWVLCTIDLSSLISFGSSSVSFNIAPRPSAVAIQSGISTQESDFHRWNANVMGLKMWLESPLWGAGLGGFLHQSQESFGFPLIIHSTPIWLLAEFGLFGLAAMIWALVIMWGHVKGMRPSRLLTHDAALILLLICFALFCQLHEMLYQRALWLFIGALLARPLSRTLLKK